MQRQSLAAIEDQIGFFIESDAAPANRQLPAFTNRREKARYCIHVDGVRLVSRQSKQYRLVAAVAFAGRAERTVQFHVKTCGILEQPLAGEAFANMRAARIGPTVCELEGPMPILNRSNALTAMEYRKDQ